MSLGENYARTMGVRVREVRTLTASVLPGVTAYCGLIAFLGLAVPHVCGLSLGTADAGGGGVMSLRLHELSDGERRWVLIARALAQEPSVILLDEPTALLDVTSRVALMGLLRKLARERELVIVVSTNDLELALRVADRVWLLGSDGVLHTGTPGELTGQGLIGECFDDEEGLAACVADVSSVGPYFELEVAPPEQDWRPFMDAPALAERIDEVAKALGTEETRVAASVLFQGLAARLWSPVIGAAVAYDLLLDLEHLYWRPVPSGPLPLRVHPLTAWHTADPDLVYRNVVTGLLEPLAATVSGIVELAPGLLWGNAASALAGSVRALAGRRPELTAKAVRLGRELLEIGRLRGTGELAEPAPGHPFFVRRSCCLYYRVPDGGKCGDCALIPTPARERQWAREMRGTP
ncbi:ferric iron reductase protein FhuF [Nonomuraea endophytica]|uniref:Ferric iron reductase protein FhuF n=1 Tax=Nonomuraea endophytica TaxID=714136 RepID=A0A7W8AEQ9_9ACTN|nr:ferric iron reductase protein FhuF [Nonomuraea endophytica]